MQKAEKRGGSWRVRAYADGQSKSFTAPTKKEAERMAAAWIAGAKEKASSMTLEEAMTSYIDSKSNVLSPSTIRGYRSWARYGIDEQTKKIRIDRITNQQLQACINALAKDHSPKTCHNVRGLITAVFAMFRPDMQIRITVPARTKTEKSIPTEEEVKRMLQASEGTLMEVMILLAAFGSLRRSEICGLYPENVHDDHIDIISVMVPDENDEFIIKDQPKSYAGYRSVHLPPDAMAKVKAAAAATKPGCTIYNNTPNSLDHHFRRIQKAAGLDHIYGFHSLRHFYATSCHYLGIPDKAIAKAGGWADVATLQRIYQHAVSDKDKEMHDRIDRFYAMLKN